jgi:hypothetical protein
VKHDECWNAVFAPMGCAILFLDEDSVEIYSRDIFMSKFIKGSCGR